MSNARNLADLLDSTGDVKSGALDNVESFTKSSSDPTINTNGLVGDVFVNTTSGEMFVLTDATSGANVWTNIGEGAGNLDFPVASSITASVDLNADMAPSTATNVTFTNASDSIDTTFDWTISDISNTNVLATAVASGTVDGVSSATFTLTTGATTDTQATFNVNVTDSDGYTSTKQFTITAVLSEYDVDFLVIAGGGAGGGDNLDGGGGAGGYRTSYGSTSGGGASAESSLTLAIGTTYTITVGAGGAGSHQNNGQNGGTSSISGSDITDITTVGGGTGTRIANWYSSANPPTEHGGSGGGFAGAGYASAPGNGTTGQGYDGGWADSNNAGGGGGAGGVGGDATSSSSGNGGAGHTSSITGSSVCRAGGGAGGTYYGATNGSATCGGAVSNNQSDGSPATANTGGGGGGPSYPSAGNPGGNGGSGLVVLRFPTAMYSGTTTGSPSVSTSGSDTILTFTGSGSYTA